MKKKINLILFLFIIIVNCYSYDKIQWKTTYDLTNITSQESSFSKRLINLKKGTILNYTEVSGINFNGYNSGFKNEFYISAVYENEKVSIPVDSIVNTYCKQKLPKELLSKANNKYIDENTLTSLYTNNLNYLKRKYPNQTIDEDLYRWIDNLDIQGGDLHISNVYIRIMDSFGCGNSGYFIQNIRKIKSNLYSIKVICNHYYRDDSLIQINPNDEILLLLEIDNDYINIYLNDKNTLFKTYVKITEQTENEINNFAKGKEFNINNITWPRHADGTCDYDESKSISTEQTTTDSVKKKKKK